MLGNPEAVTPLVLFLPWMVWAQPAASDPAEDAAGPGSTYTFYGLLELEKDPGVADAEKIRQWQAFIERSRAQVAYADKAVLRWERAARDRLLKRALETENDASTSAQARHQAWRLAAQALGDDAEGRKAAKRAEFWFAEELRARIARAKEVEEAGRPKVERIRAWKTVGAWAPKAGATMAAQRRIAALQEQLYRESMSLDALRGVDDATKVQAWRDVLAGEPTEAQARRARRRLTELGAVGSE